MLLKKGLEIEMFAGDTSGNVLPLSNEIINSFKDFSQEPDQRNFEYTTDPITNYDLLAHEIMSPRLKVRDFLSQRKKILIPGSTIPLTIEKKPFPSKPEDPYHQFILDTYKTSIITTSIHINFGLENNSDFFKILSALRLDTPLFLALSASSCFHDGKLTDYKSYRWASFPKTPTFVPFFLNHQDFINWFNEKLQNKEMFNERHMWTSIRPNGDNRPFDLNRIEIRICDFISDLKDTLAVIAFIECLIQYYLNTKRFPSILNKSKKELDELATTIDKQENLVAKDGLDAIIFDWRSGNEKKCSDIISSTYASLEPIASSLNILKYLSPVLDILKSGNEADNFIKKYKVLNDTDKTIQFFISEFANADEKYKTLLEIK